MYRQRYEHFRGLQASANRYTSSLLVYAVVVLFPGARAHNVDQLQALSFRLMVSEQMISPVQTSALRARRHTRLLLESCS